MPVIVTTDKKKRDDIRNLIHSTGVQTSVHYPAIHRFSIYKNYPSYLPNTDYVTEHEITLPMYAKLGHDDIDYIVDTLNICING